MDCHLALSPLTVMSGTGRSVEVCKQVCFALLTTLPTDNLTPSVKIISVSSESSTACLNILIVVILFLGLISQRVLVLCQYLVFPTTVGSEDV
ncbi:hypothetical protein Mp_1g03890 [Marchantia polymorpha subsp. ruderalis]|uniref:Uncharacterized protein n=2 Tax=Marchantia polymorpha TaxID=3197 RepID=A0AAF6AL93_MARPO|nr:hypothetical protein MARPO_0005s0218 [Marchantia polymorpha]BBM97213.1 hypothetical protein Mp_1g03890 [Marchantia polymorpha subsp. ruderalis]|eukprot:PTQ48595.1 hypothetical protein MARPO_0005s0218 [Marchantia polymorpha]